MEQAYFPYSIHFRFPARVCPTTTRSRKYAANIAEKYYHELKQFCVERREMFSYPPTYLRHVTNAWHYECKDQFGNSITFRKLYNWYFRHWVDALKVNLFLLTSQWESFQVWRLCRWGVLSVCTPPAPAAGWLLTGPSAITLIILLHSLN